MVAGMLHPEDQFKTPPSTIHSTLKVIHSNMITYVEKNVEDICEPLVSNFEAYTSDTIYKSDMELENTTFSAMSHTSINWSRTAHYLKQ